MKAQRVFAYLIDAVLIGIVTSLLCFITGLEIKTLWSSGTGLRILYNPVTGLNLVVAALYFLTDVMNNGSPGKKLLGLSVSQKVPQKESIGTALTRSLVKVLSIHLLIGVILFLIGNENSSLHDKAAGTTVHKKIVLA